MNQTHGAVRITATMLAIGLIGCTTTTPSTGPLRGPVETRSATTTAAAPALAIEFDVKSDFGDETKWSEDYLRRAARQLIVMMNQPAIAPPTRIAVEFRRDPALPGVGGWAGPTMIGFVSNEWPLERNRRWIVTHELVNLMTAHYAGGGGFPSDWWSDGRSPFPEYASCVVMAALGDTADAQWRRDVSRDKPDHELFWALHDRYGGFDVFARFLKLLRDDGVVLGDIGKPWPAPDATRSLYAATYLSIAAGENVAPLLRTAGVGREPSDWKGRHPEIVFEEYTLSDADVERVIRRRQELFGVDADAARDDAKRQRFRLGDGSD